MENRHGPRTQHKGVEDTEALEAEPEDGIEGGDEGEVERSVVAAPAHAREHVVNGSRAHGHHIVEIIAPEGVVEGEEAHRESGAEDEEREPTAVHPTGGRL